MSLELVFLETAKLTPTRPFIQCLCDDLIVDAKREVFQTLIGYLFASRGDRRLSIVPNLKSQKDKANDYSAIGDTTNLAARVQQKLADVSSSQEDAPHDRHTPIRHVPKLFLPHA